MILVIVESPAKCKKIEGYLGSPYKCMASFGHIREFKNGLKSVDYNNNYKAEFVVSKNKKKYVNSLRTAIKNATEVILATDDDREGEAIAWHLCKVFRLNIKTTKRIIFHEITKKAILKAVNNPTRLDMSKVNSQQCRQILDLIVGFTVSPVLWKYISRTNQKGLSAGRCQTPALNLVYENEKDCKENMGQQVYDTIGLFTHLNIEFKLFKNFNNVEKVKTFLEKTKQHQHILKVIERKKVKKSPPKPFITSTLQQKASNMFNFSPKMTMQCAQKLYENGYITYMRTDNPRYSKDFINSAKKNIVCDYSQKYVGKNLSKISLGEKKQEEKKKDDTAQEAHEAIRPTNILNKSVPVKNKITKNEVKLYNLIWKNSLQSCMSSSLYYVVNSQITAPDNLIYKNKSEKNIFLGWEIIDKIEKDETIYDYLENLLNDDEKKVNYSKISSNVTVKKAKSRYTEARLVQILEKKGIGRPSTFSSLISKIVEREYVKKMNLKGRKIKCENLELKNYEIKVKSVEKVFGDEKNKLIIQDKGIIVIEFLNQYFNNLFNYDYTKNMETMLDKISEGNLRWTKPCDDCRKEIDSAISKISINSNNKMSKNNNMKKGIKIDDKHTWIIAKYGPVILCDNNGDVTFKKVKKDIDLEKLKRGEYKLEDLILSKEEKMKSSGKVLGDINGDEVVLKNGKFGVYVQINGKNKSIKTNKKFEDITLSDVKQSLKQKSSSIIKKISDIADIRNGKYGPYVYYKSKDMKKPKFIPLKQTNVEEVDMDWIYDNM